jgi:hypothetical protein
MINNDLTIIIVSCDAYQDIDYQYLKFLHENWRDCPFEIVFAMETKQIERYDIKTVVCGENTTWTQRAIEAVKSAKTQYILLSIEDLFISKPVNNTDILSILDFVKKEKIKYYRIPVFKVPDKATIYYPNSKHAQLIRRDRRYNVSLGTSIWDRDELLTVLGDGTMSAWDLENYFLKKAEHEQPGYLDRYVTDDRLLLHTVHMIKSGKWIPKSVKKLEKLGYKIDASSRGYISFSDRIKLNSIYSWMSINLPSSLRNKIKCIMSKLGFKFASQ